MTTLFNSILYADYFTFYLQDRDSQQDMEVLASNPADFEKMLAVGDQMLHINTKRYGEVKVQVLLYAAAPPLQLANCDRANECSLHITTAALLGNVISGYQDPLLVNPGYYRVRILYKNLASVQSDFEGDDEYVIELWPEEGMGEVVYWK